MPLPTENVGSLSRPARLQAAIQDYDARKITLQQLALEQDPACLDSITRMEATGAPTVSDGERRASSFATYPLMDTLEGRGLAENLAPDGQSFAIFGDGHNRRLPRFLSAFPIPNLCGRLRREGNEDGVETSHVK